MKGTDVPGFPTFRDDGSEGSERKEIGFRPAGRPLCDRREDYLPELYGAGPTLEHLTGSRTRARLIARLLADTDEASWLRQIQRDVAMGCSNVQRELAWLRSVRLVRVERIGGAHLHRVDVEHPLCEPLRGLVLGAAEVDAASDLPPHAERGTRRARTPADEWIWFR